MGVSSMVAPLVMMSESPSVRMSCASIRRCGSPPPVTRTSRIRWTRTPRRKNGGITRSAPSRGYARPDRQEVREVHPQHHEVALREVHDAHDAEDQGEP